MVAQARAENKLFEIEFCFQDFVKRLCANAIELKALALFSWYISCVSPVCVDLQKHLIFITEDSETRFYFVMNRIPVHMLSLK